MSIPIKNSYPEYPTESGEEVGLDFSVDPGDDPGIPESGVIAFKFRRKFRKECDDTESVKYGICLEKIEDVDPETRGPPEARDSEEALNALLEDIRG